MAKLINLEVITPSKKFYEGQVRMVICNTLTGEEGFMANHAWACKLLAVGELWIQEEDGGDFKCAAVSGGYIDVKDHIMIYTDAAEWSADIDMERALSVKESAQAFLDAAYADGAPEQDNADIERAKIELAKSITRMNVAKGGSKRKHS